MVWGIQKDKLRMRFFRLCEPAVSRRGNPEIFIFRSLLQEMIKTTGTPRQNPVGSADGVVSQLKL